MKYFPETLPFRVSAYLCPLCAATGSLIRSAVKPEGWAGLLACTANCTFPPARSWQPCGQKKQRKVRHIMPDLSLTFFLPPCHGEPRKHF